MSTFGLGLIIILCILVLVLPRKLAFIPIMIVACYVTLGQILLIASFHFSAMRIIILFTWLRLIVRREIFSLKLNSIDKMVMYWLIVYLITNTLLWQTSEAFIYILGVTYNAAGLYFLFRFLIRDIYEIENVIKISALIILPLAIFMLHERYTGNNLFSIFGGVDELSWIRDGKVRAQGPFMHAILAGIVGAALMPLFVSLWFSGKARLISLIGFVAATTMTITSNSSGPIISYFAGIIGLMMWYFRRYMRSILLTILCALIVLHLVMNAPVWFIIARMGDLIGGGGYHRSAIIDAAIRRFNEWWLIGTKYTADWLPYHTTFADGKVAVDMTNQFISIGVKGGMVTMLLFIAIIMRCFRGIGLAMQSNENQSVGNKLILWSLGTSLLVHVTAFMSVNYFDQTIVVWYSLLAMISAVSLQKQQESFIIAQEDINKI